MDLDSLAVFVVAEQGLEMFAAVEGAEFAAGWLRLVEGLGKER